jgi:hypothetical protein
MKKRIVVVLTVVFVFVCAFVGCSNTGGGGTNEKLGNGDLFVTEQNNNSDSSINDANESSEDSSNESILDGGDENTGGKSSVNANVLSVTIPDGWEVPNGFDWAQHSSYTLGDYHYWYTPSGMEAWGIVGGQVLPGTSGVNIREAPSENAQIVATIPEGDYVNLGFESINIGEISDDSFLFRVPFKKDGAHYWVYIHHDGSNGQHNDSDDFLGWVAGEFFEGITDNLGHSLDSW